MCVVFHSSLLRAIHVRKLCILCMCFGGSFHKVVYHSPFYSVMRELWVVDAVVRKFLYIHGVAEVLAYLFGSVGR